MKAPADLGEYVSGVVIDADYWDHTSRVHRLRPARVAGGTVHVIYPHAPAVVGIRTRDGDQLHIVMRRRS